MKRVVQPEAHEGGRNRSAQRRAARNIDKLVLQLVELREAEILDLPISASLQREINTAREIRSRAARRRQLRYVAGLLRSSEAELVAIQRFLDTGARLRIDPLADVRHLEQWRADLCDPERFSSAMECIRREFPHLERGAIERLARTVHEHGEQHKAYRELYKRLRIASEQLERDAEDRTEDA